MSGSSGARERGALQSWLEACLATCGGFAGTVHRRETVDGVDRLRLAAAVNIPAPVLAAVETVPRGKGMAGLAWERGLPVQTCNLQTDATGDVRPGARAVDAQAAVALPVFDADRNLRGVVGFAFRGERELAGDELAALTALAARWPEEAA